MACRCVKSVRGQAEEEAAPEPTDTELLVEIRDFLGELAAANRASRDSDLSR